jgi:hypothetical protein
MKGVDGYKSTYDVRRLLISVLPVLADVSRLGQRP